MAPAALCLACLSGQSAILKVGPGERYSTIEDAYASATSGDTILVYSLEGGAAYSQTRLYITKSNISVIGQAPAGKRVVLDGAGFNYSGAGSTPRAMFQFNLGVTNWLVANFEIKNCSNTSYNGAAFRINQGSHITIRNCEVHHCDMGFMSNGSAAAGTAANILIEDCIIHDNGNWNDPGYNHNLYMAGTSVILRGCHVYSSTTGHNVKSRAHITILDGCFVHHSANRELDLVDESGNTTIPSSHAMVIGCVIAKHPACPGNRATIHFGQDGGADHNGTLYIINSTIVTPYTSPVVDLSAPNAGVCFRNTLVVDPNGSATTKTLVNARNGASYARASGQNLWLSYGFSPPSGGFFSEVVTGARGYVPPFRQPSRGDYRLTTPVLGIVDAGREVLDMELPTELRGFSLRSFSPDLGSQRRLVQNRPDVGAFEWRVVTQVNSRRPASPVRLVFVHESCGQNWLDSSNGTLGDTLGRNNYRVCDVGPAWSAPENPLIGATTDIGQWYTWFRDNTVQNNGAERHLNIVGALYQTNARYASYNQEMCPDPGGENTIVVLLSGFLNSNVRNDNGTLPSELFGQPCSIASHTLSNCKAVYNEILRYMKTREDKMFVVVTAPPLLPASTTPEMAANARTLNTWLVTSWLDDADWENRNVSVFDLYNVLTHEDNHHRVNGKTIEYVTTNGTNFAGSYCEGDDNHPTLAGNRKATAEFVSLLNVFYNRWMLSRGFEVPAESGTLYILY